MFRLVFIWCVLFTSLAWEGRAEQEQPYPDVIIADTFTFQSISEDSVEILIEHNTEDRLSHERAPGADLEAYLFDIDNMVYIAYKDGFYWKVSTKGFSKDYYTGYSITAANLDNGGEYELLIDRSGMFSKTGRYSGADNRYGSYLLINLDKEQVFYLKETYLEDFHYYTGYRAGVDATEKDIKREDEEYNDDGNFEQGHDADDCTVRIMPGKVIFENIDCPGCEENGIDTLFAIVYSLKNDTLSICSRIPRFKNLAAEFGYRVYKGKVGAYPVTMYLSKMGDYFGGYYYYDKHDKAIGLSDAHYGDTAQAEVILRETSGRNNFFRGGVVGNTFSGKWTDGNKTLDFILKEDYSNGAIRLKAYAFADSVIWGSNRVDVNASYYMADTTAMSSRDAMAFIDVVFGDKGYYGDELLNAPKWVFHLFRSNAMSWINEELFRDTENAKLYKGLGWSEEYNRNGLLSMIISEGEYMGGAHPNHSINLVIYDAQKKKRLSRQDIFNCPDSVLRIVVDGVYQEQNEGRPIAEYYDMFDATYPGALSLKPGFFSFYFAQYPATEFVDVPVALLEEYIEPAYKKRLLK